MALEDQLFYSEVPAMNEWETLADELDWKDVGGRLLRNLAKGIYSHEAVLREYVQNARDAYFAEGGDLDNAEVVLRPEGKDLVIFDKGAGMAEGAIRAVKRIAVSDKVNDPDMAGFRGIGIWAGLEFCERLIVTSSARNEDWRYRLTIEFAELLRHCDDNIDIKRLVDPRYVIERSSEKADRHYSQVRLVNVSEPKLLDAGELVRIASTVLPCRINPAYEHYSQLQKVLKSFPGYQEFTIQVETPAGKTEAFRSFPQGTEPPEVEILKTADGNELARVWYGRTTDTSLRDDELKLRGFRLRADNIAVGGINIYDDERGHHWGINRNLELKTAKRLNWFCGEIHITSDDIRPNTPRNDLELNGQACEVIAEVRDFYRRRIAEAGASSEFNSLRKQLDLATEFATKYEGSRLRSNTSEADELLEHVAKLTTIRNQTRGRTTDEKKNFVRGLLQKQEFKTGLKRTLESLKSIDIDCAVTGTSPKKAGGAGGAGNGWGESEVAETPESGEGIDRGSGAYGGNPAAIGFVDGLTPELRELVSDLIATVEERLGEGAEELTDLAESILRVVAAWWTKSRER